MDIDTMILMGLTLTAFCWWVGLRVHEDRKFAKELVEQEKDKIKRKERVKRLTNRQ
ncbi:hypothetical protein [Desulforhopalus sp. IMCC35007]|uniref:hypothetical protein n=1 Tax=Desulforhopalus sp. IMCC35007 TaxID=2569543 RepID=UPI00145DF7E6|nr:hypothetical protein [Desulforhopalus sp. IMCC35007]